MSHLIRATLSAYVPSFAWKVTRDRSGIRSSRRFFLSSSKKNFASARRALRTHSFPRRITPQPPARGRRLPRREIEKGAAPLLDPDDEASLPPEHRLVVGGGGHLVRARAQEAMSPRRPAAPDAHELEGDDLGVEEGEDPFHGAHE